MLTVVVGHMTSLVCAVTLGNCGETTELTFKRQLSESVFVICVVRISIFSSILVFSQ